MKSPSSSLATLFAEDTEDSRGNTVSPVNADNSYLTVDEIMSKFSLSQEGMQNHKHIISSAR